MTERLLTYKDVVRETTLSESTVRRLMRDGRFPRPVTLLPGRKVFKRREVDAAVERLLADAQDPRGPLRTRRLGRAAAAHEHVRPAR